MSAILQGVAISIIAPLIDVSSNQKNQNILTGLIESWFNLINLDLTIENVLFFGFVISLFASASMIMATFFQKEIQLDFEVGQKNTFYGLLGNLKLIVQPKMNFGRITQVVQQETKTSAMLIEYFIRFLSALLQIGVYIVIISIISYEVIIGLALLMFILWLPVKHFYVLAKKQGRLIGICGDKLQANFNIMIYGYTALKSFIGYKSLVYKQQKILNEYKSRSKNLALTESFLNGLFEPLAMLAILAMFLIYGFSISELFVVTAVIIRLYGVIRGLQNVHYKMSFHYASLQRIEKLKRDIGGDNQYSVIKNSF